MNGQENLDMQNEMKEDSMEPRNMQQNGGWQNEVQQQAAVAGAPEGRAWAEQIKQREEEQRRLLKQREEQDAKGFRVFGPATLLYALLFVICLYRNWSGITSPVWAAGTVVYMVYMAKQMGAVWKPINTFISIVIAILGISNFVTGNSQMIAVNYLAIWCLMIANMMYLYLEMNNVNVTQHLLLLCRLAFGCLNELGTPLRQLKAFLKTDKRKKNEKLGYVIVGIIIAVPVFFSMIWLLSSADEIFHQMFENLAEMFWMENLFSNVIGICIMFLVGYILPYAFLKNIQRHAHVVHTGKSGTGEPVIAIIVAAAVSVLYVLFCGIQVVYLFMGKGTLPSNYTYAQYAREGFFQLLFVSGFNAVMVLIGIEFFKTSRILKGILTLVCGCTFVMIASSAYRMSMYISEYGLTVTRVLVLWALVVITLILTGLLIQLFWEHFDLFRYSMIVMAVCFVALSLSHMDYWIAKYDWSRYAQMQAHTIKGDVDGSYDEFVREYDLNDPEINYVDYDYLMSLSTDAAPVMAQHMEEIRAFCRQQDYNLKYAGWTYIAYEEDGKDYHQITLRNFNLSRYIARLSVEQK